MLSQVVPSFGIPFALVPLVVLTSKARIMGSHVNRRRTTICACAWIVWPSLTRPLARPGGQER